MLLRMALMERMEPVLHPHQPNRVRPPQRRFLLHCLLIFYNYIFVVHFDREGREWTGGAHGEWKAKESPETANHLLQFSAGGSPAQIPEDPVSRAPRTRRTGGVFGPHTDPGQNAYSSVHDVAVKCVDSLFFFLSRPVSKSCFRIVLQMSKICALFWISTGEDMVSEPTLKIQEVVEKRRDSSRPAGCFLWLSI